MADPKNNMMEQYVLIKGLALNTPSISKLPYVDDNDNIINIQLLYDPNGLMKSNLWDGSFHSISLYRSLEYLASDSKNVKDSLNFITKYISNKQINPAKSNNIEDFKGIGKVVWNLISSIYQEILIADKNSNTLRQKISLKFTPKVTPVSNESNNTISKLVPASIKKIPSSILAKSQKEVNQISKYFKNIKLAIVTKLSQKSYAYASKPTTSTAEVIKIKDTFLALDAKKIDQIQNIVKGGPKPKLHIQMMTKESSRKQVIILINSNNTVKFMKNSSLHIANINRSLRNMKSEVLVDFI